MRFTLQVVRSNETAARAVLNGGLLEVLVDVVSHGFNGWDSEAISKATEVLAALAEYPSILPLLKRDDIAWSWPYSVPGLRPSVMEEMEIEEGQVSLFYFMMCTWC